MIPIIWFLENIFWNSAQARFPPQWLAQFLKSLSYFSQLMIRDAGHHGSMPPAHMHNWTGCSPSLNLLGKSTPNTEIEDFYLPSSISRMHCLRKTTTSVSKWHREHYTQRPRWCHLDEWNDMLLESCCKSIFSLLWLLFK